MFLNRLDDAYKKAKSDGTFEAMKLDIVQYVDEGVHTGEILLFHKYRPFDYQSEMRIVLSYGLAKPYTLELGSLADGDADAFGVGEQFHLHWATTCSHQRSEGGSLRRR